MELFKQLYYWFDLAIGFGTPAVLFAFYRKSKISRYIWVLFWIGVCLGITWEVPIFLMSTLSRTPLITWIRPFPVHYLWFLISHLFWDGGLFLPGVVFVYALRHAHYFSKFNFGEMIVLLVYGQVSELLVEISSTMNDGWVYIDRYWWNPVLFNCNHHPITLLPQLIWLIAPAIFYVIALRLKQVSV